MKVEELRIWRPTARWMRFRTRVLDCLTHEEFRRMIREVDRIAQPNGQTEL